MYLVYIYINHGLLLRSQFKYGNKNKNSKLCDKECPRNVEICVAHNKIGRAFGYCYLEFISLILAEEKEWNM